MIQKQPKKMSQRDKCVFIKTVRDIEKGDIQMLYLFQMIGVKHILNDQFTQAIIKSNEIWSTKAVIEDPRREFKGKHDQEALNFIKRINAIFSKPLDHEIEHLVGEIEP